MTRIALRFAAPMVLEAIQSATLLDAEMLRLEKTIGAVEAGFEADLVVVERNPLERIATLQHPLLVISNGRAGLDRLNVARSARASTSQPE